MAEAEVDGMPIGPTTRCLIKFVGAAALSGGTDRTLEEANAAVRRIAKAGVPMPMDLTISLAGIQGTAGKLKRKGRFLSSKKPEAVELLDIDLFQVICVNAVGPTFCLVVRDCSIDELANFSERVPCTAFLFLTESDEGAAYILRSINKCCRMLHSSLAALDGGLGDGLQTTGAGTRRRSSSQPDLLVDMSQLLSKQHSDSQPDLRRAGAATEPGLAEPDDAAPILQLNRSKDMSSLAAKLSAQEEHISTPTTPRRRISKAEVRQVEGGFAEPSDDMLESLGRRALRRRLSKKHLSGSRSNVIRRPDLVAAATPKSGAAGEDNMDRLLDNGSVFGFAMI